MNYNKCSAPVTEIYALVDPDDGTIRYVGASVNPKQRLQNHRGLGVGSEEKHVWLSDLKARGKKPKIRILDTCPTENRKEVENQWILKMLADGHKLYNVIYPGYDRRAIMKKQKESVRQMIQKVRDSLGR